MPTVYSPPVSTYVALATVTLDSTDASITFSSIPATYRDLILVVSMKVETSVEPKLRFNDDTGSNYSMVQMAGNGSATLSNSGTTNYGWITPNSSPSTTTFTAYKAQIMDYSATDKQKTWLSRFDPDNGYVNALANRWANTNAINQIEIFVSSSNFSTGSTFSLFGIEA